MSHFFTFCPIYPLFEDDAVCIIGAQFNQERQILVEGAKLIVCFPYQGKLGDLMKRKKFRRPILGPIGEVFDWQWLEIATMTSIQEFGIESLADQKCEDIGETAKAVASEENAKPTFLRKVRAWLAGSQEQSSEGPQVSI